MLDPLSRHKSMLIEFSISPIFLGKISKNARRRSFEIERLFQIKEWSFQIEDVPNRETVIPNRGTVIPNRGILC